MTDSKTNEVVEAMVGELERPETLEFLVQYGGRCRDCADVGPVCESTGIGCGERRKAMKFALDALAYGVRNGFALQAALTASEPLLAQATKIVGGTEYAPCPTCRQYSHSIGEDQLADAFMHFQSMYSHRGDGIPTQHSFDERTRDAAQVLMIAAQGVAQARSQAVEDAAKVAETHFLDEKGWVNSRFYALHQGAKQIAKAIRALAQSEGEGKA